MEKLLKTLHPLERKILPLLKEEKTLTGLTEKSGLQEVEVMRALQWLENKEILKIKTELKETVTLDENGKKYVEFGLPEKKFLTILTQELTITEITEKTVLNKNEINACIGILRKKAAIEMMGEKIRITQQGKDLLKKESLEEKFLKKLNTVGVMELKFLLPEEKYAFEELKKRKEIIKVELQKIRTANLTTLGEKLIQTKLSFGKIIDVLTPEMLRTGNWKKKQFRRYDVKINVPQISGGKTHFVNQAKEYAKRTWMDMGFKEMTGPILNTSFWNFDALFTAQDHPVRELHDTFFIKNPAKGKLPNKKLVETVRKVHENGWTTGSKGWGYKWSPEEAKKNVLRTHTTILSAQTLARIKKDGLPAKYFAIGKNFRNETLSWKHLFEFNQTEGIVVDPNANFRHLLGYLKEFFQKMGHAKARFRPAYFPYTEMSVGIEIFHPTHKKWVELGGAGIFRPEVVKPLLGKDIPVLAWGPGFDRIIMEYYRITDIRDLYKNDLKQLRETKTWMK